MFNNKKGAIEMSMTTIIVIVLGVTLLILGLAFVRNIFLKTGGMSDEIFTQAQSQLGQLERVDKFLTVAPGRFDLKQNEFKGVKVVVLNQGEEIINVRAVTNVVGGDNNLECKFAETKESSSDTHKIASGKQAEVMLVVKDMGGPLRQSACKVAIEGAPEGEDNRASILVNVIAS